MERHRWYFVADWETPDGVARHMSRMYESREACVEAAEHWSGGSGIKFAVKEMIG